MYIRLNTFSHSLLHTSTSTLSVVLASNLACDICTGTNSYLFYIWADSKYTGVVVQAKLFFAALGGLCAPLVISVFLVDLHPASFTSCQLANCTTNATTLPINFTLQPTAATTIDGDVHLVRWSFVLTGANILLPAILWTLMSLPAVSTRLVTNTRRYSVAIATINQTVGGDSANKKLGLSAFIATTTAFGVTMCSTFAGFNQYLQTYVTLALRWDVQTGAYLNTAHNAGFAVARMAAMPLSRLLRPQVVIGWSLAVWASGLGLVVLTDINWLPGNYGLWAGVILIGIGWSPVMSYVYIWTNQIVGLLSPVQSAIIGAGMSVGFHVGPSLIGALIPIYGHKTPVYVTVCSTIIHCAIFVILAIIVRPMLNKNKNNTVTFLSITSYS